MIWKKIIQTFNFLKHVKVFTTHVLFEQYLKYKQGVVIPWKEIIAIHYKFEANIARVTFTYVDSRSNNNKQKK